MQAKDIEVNGIYKAKVSNRIVNVRVTGIHNEVTFRDKLRKVYDVVNLATNRRTKFHSAAKFRERVDTTPRDAQFLAMIRKWQAANAGGILVFRKGDYYEMYFADAEIGAKLLELTLVGREKQSPNPTPMVCFPFYRLDEYSKKLAAAGYRVAVIEPGV